MALSKLAVRRLTKLATFLASMSEKKQKHFDMGTWFIHQGAHEHSFGAHVKPGDLKHCGTTACALGWAATIPAFYKAGLRVPTNGGGIYSPVYTAARFFDISDDDADFLFYYLASPGSDIRTPKQWAARCRKFIRENA